MDRDLLNEVKFKTVKLKGTIKQCRDEEPINRVNTPLKRNLSRLAFFIFLLIALLFGLKIGIEYTFGFTRGEGHSIPIQQLWQEFKQEAQ